MFELLTCMMKEEWRMHSSLFGNLMFALFPVLVTVFAFICCLLLPVFQTILSFEQLSLLAHYLFVLFGVTVGAFGLLGREVMNRRFGHASLLAYSSRSLPISERSIFVNFFLKDVIYYVITPSPIRPPIETFNRSFIQAAHFLYLRLQKYRFETNRLRF